MKLNLQYATARVKPACVLFVRYRWFPNETGRGGFGVPPSNRQAGGDAANGGGGRGRGWGEGQRLGD